MPMSFEEKLRSPQFTFVVGDDETPKEIVVHSAFLAELSGSLNELLNGKMKESNEKRVAFSDLSVETFAQVCQYAYVGDYEPVPCVLEPPSDDPADEDEQPEQEDTCPQEVEASFVPLPPPPFDLSMMNTNMMNSSRTDTYYPTYNPTGAAPYPPDYVEPWRYPTTGKAKRDGYLNGRGYNEEEITRIHEATSKLVHAKLQSSFQSHAKDSSARTSPYEPKGNKGRNENFAPVFLAHARIYVFADQWTIENLKSLVLEKVYKTLEKFRIYACRVGDIIKFIRFVYQNTCENDKLRRMVLDYVASNFKMFAKDEEYRQLLREGGDFPADIWDVVAENFLVRKA